MRIAGRERRRRGKPFFFDFEWQMSNCSFVSQESTLAFFYGRRICRLAGSILQPTISFLTIFFLLSSVTAVQQQLVNQQQISSSIIPTNGTTTSIYNSSRQRLQAAIPFSSSVTADDELLNLTSFSSSQSASVRNPALLIFIIIICSLMTLLTIVGNLVVILTVCLVRKLQTASNILIVSLAVSDIFVGLFIMPLSLGRVIPIYFVVCIALLSFHFSVSHYGNVEIGSDYVWHMDIDWCSAVYSVDTELSRHLNWSLFYYQSSIQICSDAKSEITFIHDRWCLDTQRACFIPADSRLGTYVFQYFLFSRLFRLEWGIRYRLSFRSIR